MKLGFRSEVISLGFFDLDNLVVIGHGFQKKTQKTPKQQIERAEQIKKEYYESKE